MRLVFEAYGLIAAAVWAGVLALILVERAAGAGSSLEADRKMPPLGFVVWPLLCAALWPLVIYAAALEAWRES